MSASTPKKFAVIGWPIAHSRSPQIHQHFAKQFKHSIVYERRAAKTDFPSSVKDFFAEGGIGLNVTLPHKNAAARLCDHLFKAAKIADAANTLWQQDGELYGDNTDGAGLIKDLTQNHNQRIKDKQVLILGAGGATAGILLPLLAQKPARLCIANRTLEKAERLVQRFQDEVMPRQAHTKTRLQSLPLSALADADEDFDLIIQATSAGMTSALPPLSRRLCAPRAFGYDLSYGEAAGTFLSWAEDAGLQASDGLGMLVEQAALSFEIWFKSDVPDTEPVISALRGEVQQEGAL